MRSLRESSSKQLPTVNWTIIIVEPLIMTAAFTAAILIPLVKNPLWWPQS